MTSNESNAKSSAERQAETRQALKKIYLTLMVAGLIFGGVLSVGIYMAMDHFGLTARPGQLEQSKS